MARYSPSELWKQWSKSLAGLLLAVAMFIVFNNFLLALITFTFLFFIPLNDRKAESKTNTWIFAVCMILIFVMAFFYSGPSGGFDLDMDSENYIDDTSWSAGGGILRYIMPWTWTNPSAVLFFLFWFFTGIVGFLGDPESRQIIGMVFIFMSFLVFATGTGSENVGAAFFGQWWPQVNSFMMDVVEPIQNSLGTLTGTFSNAFMMLTDPIGYAHKIQEGNYVDNPTGKKGSYGVEITKFDMNYLYIGQPSIIQVNLKNEGSFPAKNVVLGISIPYKEAQKMSEVSGDTDIPYITNLGFTPGSPQNPGTEVKSPRPGVHIWGLRTDNEEEILYTDPPIASMPHQDQYFSLFTGNLTCANYVLFNLKEKSVPIRATVAYDYSVESQLNIEFVSVNEWERRVQNNQLIETQVASSISSSPVKLSISTNSQPIRVDRPFIISLDLKTEVDNSAIDDAVVTMNVPNWLLENDDLSRICFGPGTVTKNVPTTATGSLTGFETVIWKPTSGQYENYPIGSESVTLVCRFYNAESDLEKEIDTLPSKTFNIQARGDYRFYKWKDRKAPVNIGQYCCKDDDCGDDNFKCDLGKGKPGFCIQKDRDFAPHTDGT